jgi:hypothetical protein
MLVLASIRRSTFVQWFPIERREPREPSERSRLAGRELKFPRRRLAAKRRRCSLGPRRCRVEENALSSTEPLLAIRLEHLVVIGTEQAAAWIHAAFCVPTETHRERVPPRRGDAASNGSRCLPSVGSNSRVRDESRGSLELETSRFFTKPRRTHVRLFNLSLRCCRV